jgi:hypothetical protein
MLLVNAHMETNLHPNLTLEEYTQVLLGVIKMLNNKQKKNQTNKTKRKLIKSFMLESLNFDQKIRYRLNGLVII